MRPACRALLPLVALTIAACSDTRTSAAPADRIVNPDANNVPAKIDICHHSEETHSYILISVASPAIQAHLAHGDGRIGDPVPGQPGMRFAADCQPEIIPFHSILTPYPHGYIEDHGPLNAKDGIADQFFAGPYANVQNIVGFQPGTGSEDRGILEFYIGDIAHPVGHAELRLAVYAAPLSISGFVFSYAGDGQLTLDDFGAGTLVRTFSYGVSSFPAPIVLDVTTAVNALITAHAGYAGFNLRSEAYSGVTQLPPLIVFYVSTIPPTSTLELSSP